MTDAEKKKLKHPGSGPGANQIYDHLLPFGDIENNKVSSAVGRTSQSTAADQGMSDSSKKRDASSQNNYGVNFYSDADMEDNEEDDEKETCVGWLFPFCSPYNNLSIVAPTSVQKIEPKIFFANERTFLHWLHAGITLYTISSGILVFSGKETSIWAHWYAIALLPVALGFCIYALHVFLWRADRIKTRVPGRWDDPRGPYILGGTLAIILTLNFVTKLAQIWKYESNEL
jgi:uncharacterized membrane protein YidH (DUF202 family)